MIETVISVLNCEQGEFRCFLPITPFKGMFIEVEGKTLKVRRVYFQVEKNQLLLLCQKV